MNSEKKQRKMFIVVQIAIVLLVCSIYIIINTKMIKYVPACFFYKKYGLLCPACGRYKIYGKFDKLKFKKSILHTSNIFYINNIFGNIRYCIRSKCYF